MGIFRSLGAFDITPEGVLQGFRGKAARIVLPGRVTAVGALAFAGSSQITAVRCSPELRRIGQGAFQHCRQLVEAELVHGLAEIGEKAFDDCSALREITIPGSCRSIRAQAFRGCVSLQRVRLTEGIQRIDDSAFEGCTALQELILPDSVQTIGTGAFRQCSRLRRVVLPRQLGALAAQLLAECEALPEIVLPDGVSILGDDAFSGCKALSAVHLPEGLRALGAGAFAGCRSLRDIRLPQGLITVGAQAFRGTALESVTLPPAVRRLESYAFADCTQLRAVSLPEETELLGEGVFCGCTALRELRVPAGLRDIGDDCFSGTPWLAAQPGDMVIVGDGILAEYRGHAPHVILPPEVRIVLRQAFPGRPGHLTITENVERMGWDFIPGLALTCIRGDVSVTVHYEDSYTVEGRSEALLREFWETKRRVPRHAVFFRLLHPQYAFPLAVLMYLTEPEDVFYQEYMQRHVKDIMKHLIHTEDAENIARLLQAGCVPAAILDDLIACAIRRSQEGGSLEPQILLMEHKGGGMREQGLDAVFRDSFAL